MSFFDDEPTRATPRAGRPAPRPRAAAGGPRPGGPRGGGGGARRPPARSVDDQTLLVRRLVAGGGGLLVLILLVVGINGCLNGRTERALKDYTRNVASVMNTSQTDVAEPFFSLLNTGADNPTDLQAQVRQLALAAQQGAKQASGLSVPDEMQRAQGALMLVLNLRATALTKIADQIPNAQAKARSQAASVEQSLKRIAGQMRAFDASDVVYSQRVRPYITGALKAKGVSGQELPAGQFLPTITWLSVNTIAGVLNAQRAAGGTGANAAPAPGLHGHGVISVAVGTQVLNPSPAVNRIAATGPVTFNVKVANQGDNDESDVVVKVTVKAGAKKPIVGTKTIQQTKAKTEVTAAVTLPGSAPVGDSAIITVQVVGVPGEKNLTNNTAKFTALFGS